MTSLVPSDEIEGIVGVSRHPDNHYGRAVSAEQTVYILHSQACKDSGVDLRECVYSRALAENGIEPDEFPQDVPVRLFVDEKWLLLSAAQQDEQR